MQDIENIIEILMEISRHPARQILELKAQTGKKVVGCMPEYVPAELVYACGMLPVGLWGGQVTINEAKAYVPAFCCSILQSCLELGLTGAYDMLDAVIFPSLCDTLKCVSQDFKIGVPQIRHIQFTHPQMRKLEAGVQFLKQEYARVLGALEEVSGSKMSNEQLHQAIEVFNENRRVLRRFVSLARAHTDKITPLLRHHIIRSGCFMEKPRHTELLRALCDGLEALPEVRPEKSLLLTGILAEPDSLLTMISDCGLTVAADDLAQESRQFRYDVPTDTDDALYNLARWWQVFEGCSLAYDPEKKRIDMLVDEVKEHGIQGLVVCMMKFCDPEEYDYPLLKTALEKAGIPALYLELDQQSEVSGQVQTRLQAFSELLT